MTRWWAERSGEERLPGHDRLTGTDPGVLLSFSSQGISGTKFGESRKLLLLGSWTFNIPCVLFLSLIQFYRLVVKNYVFGLYVLARIEVHRVLL